jgi:hypothetical protein
MSLSDDQNKLAAEFPEALWLPEHRLCTFRPAGELTGKVVGRITAWVEAIERDVRVPFNRFTDFTKLETVSVTDLDVVNLAHWRRTTYTGALVKSAFLTGSSQTCRLAEKYQTLMRSSQIFVSVHSSIDEAASWLGVPLHVIKEPQSTDGPRTGGSASEKKSSDL